MPHDEDNSLIPIPDLRPDRPFAGIATQTLTPEQVAIIHRPPSPDIVMIKPNKEVYVSQVHYRSVLSEAFGPGGWSLAPLTPWQILGNTVCREYGLYVSGKFLASAVGEQEYRENNPTMTYATACEAAKSNALMRCCKDLNIFKDLWDKQWIDGFVAEHCLAVRVAGQTRPQWRRKDDQPLRDEQGPFISHPISMPATSSPPPHSDATQSNVQRQTALRNPSDQATGSFDAKLLAVATSTGSGPRGPWTKYSVEFLLDGGETKTLSTFSETLGIVAQRLTNKDVRVDWELDRTGRYQNLVDIFEEGSYGELDEFT